MNLVDGIILAESGELNGDELVEFVLEHERALMELQGSWQRLVLSVREAVFDNEMESRSEKY